MMHNNTRTHMSGRTHTHTLQHTHTYIQTHGFLKDGDYESTDKDKDVVKQMWMLEQFENINRK